MANIFAEHTDFLFDAVTENITGLSEEQLSWRPIEESKDIKSVLTHTVRIAYVLIPQVIDDTVKPTGWDDSYEKEKHSYQELLDDF